MDDGVRNEILNVLKSIDGRLKHIEETLEEDIIEKTIKKSPLSKSAKDTFSDGLDSMANHFQIGSEKE